MNSKPGWKSLPHGDVAEAGSAAKFETGDWRSEKPIFHADKCIHCLRCWIGCPDSAILVENEKVVGIDYRFCKGCGICSHECPVKPEKAITMEPEVK